jgi:hypothetical protein
MYHNQNEETPMGIFAHKIKAIKFVRQATKLPLKEAKYIVDILDTNDAAVYGKAEDRFPQFVLDRAHRERAKLCPKYGEFDFLEAAFTSLIQAHRGSHDARAIAEEALVLSKHMATRANMAYDEMLERMDEETD